MGQFQFDLLRSSWCLVAIHTTMILHAVKKDHRAYGIKTGPSCPLRYLALRVQVIVVIMAASLVAPILESVAAPGPLTPQQEIASFQLADPSLAVSLVAAEPLVISPVAIAWDASGRMFVAEMIDYPAGPTGGQIRMLEDGDGDGKFEKATVFADQLAFPNGVLPWNNGVLVTSAPDILYLRDTNGDGRADERRVVLTGFGQGNQQLRVNGLLWGLDNWVYGANGRSDGDIRRPSDPSTNGVSIRRRDFRFRPATGQFEAIAGSSQFGLGRDDWGSRFLSWNTIPIRHAVLATRYLDRNPHLASTESLANLLPADDTGRVFPLTPAPRVFNSESSSHFNALAGLTIYRGDALGSPYRGNAFVGESLRNLVHRRVLRPKGVTFMAERAETDKEFLASSDSWFHPVNFATGPDGALYIVDFYRQFVEHPQWVPESLRDKPPWRQGAEHGRIWRIRAANPHAETLVTKRNATMPAPLQSAELVRHLANENGWWRDTAQRLLVERQDRAAVPLLQNLARKSRSPLARVHALWTLEGLDSLDAEIVMNALQDKEPGVREHAIRLAELLIAGRGMLASNPMNADAQSETAFGPRFTGVSPARLRALRRRLVQAIDDPDPRVRFQLALTLGNLDNSVESLAKLARKGVGDTWQETAILSSVRDSSWPLLQELLKENRRWLPNPTDAQGRYLQQVAELVGLSTFTNASSLNDVVSHLASLPRTTGQLMLVAGLADGLGRAKRSAAEGGLRARSQLQSLIMDLCESAAALAISETDPLTVRLAAVRILAQVAPDRIGNRLLNLLEPKQPVSIQSAAINAIAESNDKSQAEALFENWGKQSPTTRRQVISAAFRSDASTAALLGALESGKIEIVEVDAATRQRLRQLRNIPLKEQAEKLLKGRTMPDREELIRSFQPALNLHGSPAHGAITFAKVCLNCHAILGQGGKVGPDLSGVASRPKAALLVDVLDPNRQITPDFLNFRAVTTKGEHLSGLVVSETATGVTLRRVGEPDTTLLRRDLIELRAEGASPMPEGLEQGMTQQDVADLLEFLRQPDRALLPQER